MVSLYKNQQTSLGVRYTWQSKDNKSYSELNMFFISLLGKSLKMYHIITSFKSLLVFLVTVGRVEVMS